MKRIALLALFTGLVLTSCNKSTKEYYYNRDFYESFFPPYVKRCEKFIRRVERDKNSDIVFLGDSITEGFPIKKYFGKYKIANRGISGDYTDGVIDRLEFSVYDLNPKIVYLMIGTNNLYSCMNNYEFILSGIKEHCPNLKVLVMSITPRHGDDLMQKIREKNVEIEKLSGKYGYFYINTFTAMTLNNDNLTVNNDLFKDGLHPNSNGYKVIANTIKPTIDNWLK